jgi:hypothetical protein
LRRGAGDVGRAYSTVIRSGAIETASQFLGALRQNGIAHSLGAEFNHTLDHQPVMEKKWKPRR